MKTVLFALFLLSTFTLHLRSATADLVFDIDGEPLRNGGTYYILPAFRGRGGGLELAAVGNETCPLTVVQSRSEVSNGQPLTLSSLARIFYIYEGLKLDIGFIAIPICAASPSKWTIVEELQQGWSVKITGYKNTLEGKFSIEKYESDYKLVFCPRSSVSCGDLGIYIDDDRNRRLVVTEEAPFRVMFKKFDGSSVA